MKGFKDRIKEKINERLVNEANITKDDIKVGTVIKLSHNTITVKELKPKYCVGVLKDLNGKVMSDKVMFHYDTLDNPQYSKGIKLE